MSQNVFFDIKVEDSAEVIAAISTMPQDVQKVVGEFKKDYATAVGNFKEAYLSAFSWASEAANQLNLLKSYLETERMREQIGLPKGELVNT